MPGVGVREKMRHGEVDMKQGKIGVYEIIAIFTASITASWCYNILNMTPFWSIFYSVLGGLITAAIVAIAAWVFRTRLKKFFKSACERFRKRGRPPYAKDRVKVKVINKRSLFWDAINGQRASYGQTIYLPKELAEKGIKKGRYELAE